MEVWWKDAGRAKKKLVDYLKEEDDDIQENCQFVVGRVFD